jgi:magnesium transporter
VQSSTILVRAFATGEVERDRDLSVLGSEVTVGTIIGIICGLITVFFAAWMEGGAGMHWALGYSVGVAVAAAVSWASFLGCVVPMSCRRLGIDPAIVAGPFLICLSDISGVGIYIVVASMLIGLN